MSERANVTLIAVSLAAVAALAIAYRFDPVASWDVDVARRVADGIPEALEQTARRLTQLGGGLGVAILAIATAAVLTRARRTRDASLAVLSYVGSQVSTQIMKAALGRPRPDLGPTIDLPSTAAFPSGHASASLAVLVVTAVLLGGRGAVVLAVLLSVAIGLSRVALGVHWASDVLAGWALGAAWVGACLLLRGRRRARG